MLGPDGTGGLYVSKEAIEKLAPAHVGWASVDEHDLEGGYTFKPGAGRYEVAMLPVAAEAALVAAIDWMAGWSWDWVFQRVRSLATLLKQELQRLPGVKLYTPVAEDASAGLVTFALEGVEPEKAVNWLLRERKILIRSISYPRALRASLHFFNTEEEVEALLRALRELPR